MQALHAGQVKLIDDAEAGQSSGATAICPRPVTGPKFFAEALAESEDARRLTSWDAEE